MLIESAWVAIKKDPNLIEIYQRIAKTRGGKRAIIGVARLLAGRLRSCVRLGTLYEVKPLDDTVSGAQSVKWMMFYKL